MKTVIVTGDSSEHRYVANTLISCGRVSAVLVCDQPARRSWKTVLKRDPMMFLDKTARAVFLRAIKDAQARERALEELFGKDGRAFSQPQIVSRVGRPKDGTLAQAIAALEPDILAIYGTGIIPDPILAMAKSIALNMHTGISPYYRGVSCAAWPIMNEAPDMVGATVHACMAKVDGGDIYFRCRAALAADETMHSIFGKAVLVGAQGYAHVLDQALQGRLVGLAQDLSLGKEYRGAMIGLRSEIKTRLALRRLKRTHRLATSGGAVPQ